jgi:hypothetical protein
MKLNSKVTWGLAWIGLAIVVAVPSADFLTGKMGTGTAAVVTSTTDPVTPAKTRPTAPALTATPVVKTASVTTKVTKNGVTIIPAGSSPAGASTDPVDKLLKSGKPLPDYITDDGATTAKATTPSIEPQPTQVAALPTAPVVPPTPFPSIARPHVVANPPPVDPVVIDDTADQAAIDTPDVTPVPPVGLQDDNAVSWKQARLNRYLEKHGLIDESGRSSATVTTQRPSSDYDPNGFYLSDGPNNSRAARRARLERMFADQDAQDNGDDNGDSFFNLF